MMLYPSIPLAQTLVRLLAEKNVEHIVISAGSRNAPLTNGFVANPFFKTYSIVDERAAAFFGLGIAQQIGQPVALVCTSGSALLNFYPAVAEAFYSDIPLIIISADRMPHRIDIGDGQTIRQTGVFGPHLEGAAYLKPDVAHATNTLLQNPMQKLLPSTATENQILEEQQRIQAFNTQEIERVLDIARACQGPVHFNVPLEEPLYGMTKTPLPLPFSAQGQGEQKSEVNLNLFRQTWSKAKRKMVIFGVQAPEVIDKKYLEYLCGDPSVVVLTEATSNLRLPNAINSIDVLMAPLEQAGTKFYTTLQPELLVSFGGMIVSKKIKAFLRAYAPKNHWHIDTKKAYNTYYCLDQHFKCTPNHFFNTIYSNSKKKTTSDYHNKVMERYDTYKTLGHRVLSQTPFSDLKVFDIVFKKIPDKRILHLANSSTIRYAQLFDLPKNTAVFCNRGTSGIDGSTATAVGAATVAHTPTVLITGDLSFFYDSNGLWNNYIPPTFRIIIINNFGGGIFRILPGEKDSPKYDRYFETIHRRDARHTAKSFGFSYRRVRSEWGLHSALRTFFNPASKPKILEIQTPRKRNDQVLLNYFKTMAAKTINS